MESRIRSILKDANDIAKMLRIKISGTLKALRIYQYFITSICAILPWTILEFDTLHVVQSIHQRIIRSINNGNHGGNIDLGSGCFHRNQFHYLSKKTKWQSSPQVRSWIGQVLKHVLPVSDPFWRLFTQCFMYYKVNIDVCRRRSHFLYLLWGSGRENTYYIPLLIMC